MILYASTMPMANEPTCTETSRGCFPFFSLIKKEECQRGRVLSARSVGGSCAHESEWFGLSWMRRAPPLTPFESWCTQDRIECVALRALCRDNCAMMVGGVLVKWSGDEIWPWITVFPWSIVGEKRTALAINMWGRHVPCAGWMRWADFDSLPRCDGRESGFCVYCAEATLLALAMVVTGVIDRCTGAASGLGAWNPTVWTRRPSVLVFGSALLPLSCLSILIWSLSSKNFVTWRAEKWVTLLTAYAVGLLAILVVY